jgi:hypothetical protein
MLVGDAAFFLVSVTLVRCPRACISASTFDVDSGEHWDRRPKHDHEKQECVSDVARQVSHEADDERAYE